MHKVCIIMKFIQPIIICGWLLNEYYHTIHSNSILRSKLLNKIKILENEIIIIQNKLIDKDKKNLIVHILKDKQDAYINILYDLEYKSYFINIYNYVLPNSYLFI